MEIGEAQVPEINNQSEDFFKKIHIEHFSNKEDFLEMMRIRHPNDSEEKILQQKGVSFALTNEDKKIDFYIFLRDDILPEKIPSLCGNSRKVGAIPNIQKRL